MASRQLSLISTSLLTLSTPYSSKVPLVQDCLLNGKINDGGTTLRRPGVARGARRGCKVPTEDSSPLERCNALVLFERIAFRHFEAPILLVTERFINELH